MRRPQTAPRPQDPLPHEGGKDLVDLGQDGSALGSPVVGQPASCRVADADLTVRRRADEGARVLGQAEGEGIALPFVDELHQIGGDALPVADQWQQASAGDWAA
ncbi:hypothetical protein AB0I54_46010 [Streptomyces sp. NPDC050625]|uniref:hypothetical protein n=1 Tax=Streptomyces sp. NPDC050625 TaxID=3154629 RepID=UPI00343E6544